MGKSALLIGPLVVGEMDLIRDVNVIVGSTQVCSLAYGTVPESFHT
jgi:hypothetical protein